MVTWRQRFEHLRHEARDVRDAVALHGCLAAGRVELLNAESVGRYVAVPCECGDIYDAAVEIRFKIAKPGRRIPYQNLWAQDDVTFDAVQFCRVDVILDEAVAHHLAAALNAGMLGHF